MLKAIIFDFDGIIADTEPIHLEAFKIVLAQIDIELTDDDYFNKYLAYDDKTLFSKILEDKGRSADSTFIDELIEKKHVLIVELIKNNAELFKGFENFVNSVRDRYILAIASGALKLEIELILKKYGLLDVFQNITSADEVINCKPHPEPFLKALSKINVNRKNKIMSSECLVFEDSLHGIDSALSAGMKCIGITNSYSGEQLKKSALVVNSFDDVDINQIESLF